LRISLFEQSAKISLGVTLKQSFGLYPVPVSPIHLQFCLRKGLLYDLIIH